jgi:hypothetical protein
MNTVRDNEGLINAAGYTILYSFSFPDSAWWSTYYDPFEIRLAEYEKYARVMIRQWH